LPHREEWTPHRFAEIRTVHCPCFCLRSRRDGTGWAHSRTGTRVSGRQTDNPWSLSIGRRRLLSWCNLSPAMTWLSDDSGPVGGFDELSTTQMGDYSSAIHDSGLRTIGLVAQAFSIGSLMTVPVTQWFSRPGTTELCDRKGEQEAKARDHPTRSTAKAQNGSSCPVFTGGHNQRMISLSLALGLTEMVYPDNQPGQNVKPETTSRLISMCLPSL
jgi:hypothetical protein